MPDSLQELLAAFQPFLALLSTILIAVLLTGHASTRRRAARMEKQLQRLTDLQAMISAYGQSLISMDARIGGMAEKITEFTDRNLEIQSQLAFNRSFEEAARLVRDGEPATALVSSCGLSDAEAELMVRLYGSREPKPRKHLKQAPVAAEEPEAAVVVEEEIRLREALRSARGG